MQNRLKNRMLKMAMRATRTNKRQWSILMISVSALLSGCAPMTGFDCPNKAGVMCNSVDQINEKVDNGQIRGRSQAGSESSSSDAHNREEFSTFYSSSPQEISKQYDTDKPLRIGETIQRIWVAPFEDTEKNYHQDSVIYTVVREGHWVGQPIVVSDQS